MELTPTNIPKITPKRADCVLFFVTVPQEFVAHKLEEKEKDAKCDLDESIVQTVLNLEIENSKKGKIRVFRTRSSENCIILKPPEIVREFLTFNNIEYHKEVLVKESTVEDAQSGIQGYKPLSTNEEEIKRGDANTEISTDGENIKGLRRRPALKRNKTTPIRNDETPEVLETSDATSNARFSIMFSFTVLATNAEAIITRLNTLGIGADNGFGQIEVISLQLWRYSKNRAPVKTTTDENMPAEGEIPVMKSGRKEAKRSQLKEMKENVIRTVKSRIALDHVIKLVDQAAELSFDYLLLCLVASLISLVGLSVNSVVFIVASMLISPLMGPILGATFGIAIYDTEMIQHGLISEAIGLSICIFVGFIGGLIAFPYRVVFMKSAWPTEEMISRGTFDSLIGGIAVAAFSGVGVGLSILGNNTSSLVGVAISASLLPPAVNTGLLFATIALNNAVYDNSTGALDCDYEQCELIELSIMAGWSAALVFTNVVFILLTALLVFKLKEVAPTKDNEDFWKIHIPHARNYHTILHGKRDPQVKKLLSNLQTALRWRHDPHDNIRSRSPSEGPEVNEQPQVLDPKLFEAPDAEELERLIRSEGGEGSLRDIKSPHDTSQHRLHLPKLFRQNSTVLDSKRGLQGRILRGELYMKTIDAYENAHTISGQKAAELRRELSQRLHLDEIDSEPNEGLKSSKSH